MHHPPSSRPTVAASRLSTAVPGLRRIRRAVVAGLLALTALGALVAAGPAAAATATTPNACLYPLDGNYRSQAVTVTSSLVPGGAAGTPAAGQSLRLGAGTFAVQLPDYLARYGYNLGFLKEGRNTIDAKVWLALKATNTREKTKVIGPVAVRATTDITVDHADEGRYLSSTPFTYTGATIPETTWTATGGDVAFSQADAGTLPALPVGPNGASRAVTGSLVVQALFSSSANVYFDCQPGGVKDFQYDEGYKTVAPAAPLAFETAAASAGTTPVPSPSPSPGTPVAPANPSPGSPAPAPVVATPGTVSSSALTADRRGRLSVGVGCVGQKAACRGQLSLKSTAKVRVGRTVKTLTVARTVSYAVAAGARRSVGLTLGADARRLLAVRHRLGVTVTLVTSGQRLVSRRVILRG